MQRSIRCLGLSAIGLLSTFIAVAIASPGDGSGVSPAGCPPLSKKLLEAPGAIGPSNLIPACRLAEVSMKAVQGDQVSASLVAAHYSFARPNDPMTDFWIDVAVESGSPFWVEFRADNLVRQGGTFRCARAEYWLRRGIASDPDYKEKYEAKIAEYRSRPACRSEQSR